MKRSKANVGYLRYVVTFSDAVFNILRENVSPYTLAIRVYPRYHNGMVMHAAYYRKSDNAIVPIYGHRENNEFRVPDNMRIVEYRRKGKPKNKSFNKKMR